MKKILRRVEVVVVALSIVGIAGLMACKRAEPKLMARSEVLMGESPEVTAIGLNPAAEYEIAVEMTDSYERVWQSKLSFRADDFGQIDLARDLPANGLYKTPDPFGLLASMTMTTATPENWVPPAPHDFNRIILTLSRDGIALDSTETRQWIFPPDIESERIGGGLVAEFFYPRSGSKSPGVLIIGGSGGGMEWARRSAALLARKGLAAMAVAYFNSGNLPSHLVEIPVEYVEAALDSLKSRHQVNPAKIALLGYSKGAELALLLATRRPDVGVVVAIAPGSAVFQGFRPPDYPVISSWSVDGIGLPFVPNAYDKKFFETFDGMYLWYRTLSQHEAFADAVIPVEKINGDILLLSGVEDQIWPATFMAEQIVARLHINGFEHSVRHLAFPEAGHGIAAPPGESLTSVAKRLGGTVSGNARARSVGWQALEDFLIRMSAQNRKTMSITPN